MLKFMGIIVLCSVIICVFVIAGVAAYQIGYLDTEGLVTQSLEELFWTLFLMLALPLFYFIPGIAGHSTKHRAAIWMLNLLLGWTILGWIGALIWALASPKRVQAGAGQESASARTSAPT